MNIIQLKSWHIKFINIKYIKQNKTQKYVEEYCYKYIKKHNNFSIINIINEYFSLSLLVVVVVEVHAQIHQKKRENY